MKIVFICSTNASVLKKYILDFGAPQDVELISDRDCGGVEFAREIGIYNKVFQTKSGLYFSNFLADMYAGETDILFISFYTRLLKGRFIREHSGRILNFHPSILPACPGQSGFEDTIQSKSCFVGSTVHFIDEGIDTGQPLLQAAFPRNPCADVDALRHRVFLQQVVSLAQLISWFEGKRIILSDDSFIVKNAEYQVSEFVPNLDEGLSLYFNRSIKCL